MTVQQFYVYILTNKRRTVLYIGVTNDLLRRILEHRDKFNSDSFTARYNINILVYYEAAQTAYTAITREKQLKGWMRYRKADLIGSANPDWVDLYNKLRGDSSLRSE